MSVDLTALNPEFNDLPRFKPVVSAMYPEHDGDIEELRELADRIFCYPAAHIAKLNHRFIYHQLQDEKNLLVGQLLNPLTWDVAGKMLREWRRG